MKPETRNPNLKTALAYAKKKWHVFPLRTGTKKPATPKHAAENCDRTDPKCCHGHTGWEQRATTDTRRIVTAWTRNPNHGIGIACGPSDLIVVDIDTAKKANGTSGLAAFNQLVRDSGETYPATYTVATPSGGYHLYYQQPTNGAALANTANKLGTAIDTRGHGGYVAAPATTINNTTYQIAENMPVIPLPSWLHELLKPTTRPDTSSRPLRLQYKPNRYTQAAIKGETQRIRDAPNGQRNHVLFTAAIALGQLAATEHYNPNDAEADLLNAASTHFGIDGFRETEAAKTIASGLRKGLAQPRQIQRKTA